jgi:hypothetical protein
MAANDLIADNHRRIANKSRMRHIRQMQTLLIRLAVSLLAAGVASVAAFQIVFRLAWWQLEMSDPHADGQAGMGPLFGAAFAALGVATLTFALLFWRSRRWR